ncbi:hypothetical protein M145_4556 [Bacteroides fragilis str. 34-F-2 |nr:hypothetical protein M145_4556 [Bacteroides fragilis str. 34-F-2 \
MEFSWEIKHPRIIFVPFIYPELSNSYEMLMAVLLIYIKHLRIAKFINQRNALTHNSNAVNCVNDCLSFCIKDVTFYKCYVIHYL